MTAKKVKKLSTCLPGGFVKVLQALVCGTGVHVHLIYSSNSNDRYTLRLSGPWQDVVRRCVRDASGVKSSALYPPANEIDLEAIDEWPSVLLKMQRDIKFIQLL